MIRAALLLLFAALLSDSGCLAQIQDLVRNDVCPAWSELDTFIILILRKQCIRMTNEEAKAVIGVPYDAKTHRFVECAAASEEQDPATVQVVTNISVVQEALAKKDKYGRSYCYIVVFYGKGCPFSVKIAEVINALPRFFPKLNVMVIDAALTTKFNSRYGVAGTPSVILYQNTYNRARISSGYAPLKDIVASIKEYTDLEPVSKNYTILESDRAGPLVIEPDESTRHLYLLISIFCVSALASYSVVTTLDGGHAIAQWFLELVRRRGAN
ncbi:hypothetical protein L596_019994 [Steinernema carpocapsae]|uniref:Thioredoxin domain-containing protein n=1 Tax=Steinernema carpocapsae TaxID=34508 RepID=A0A4U5MS84_STECR|nr:hypothetical protein L596_019994 [Steinernema carpocapsae]